MKRNIAIVAGLITAAASGRAHAQPAPPVAPQTQPATRVTVDQHERMAEWLALIEGPNTPAARRTGARELLRQGWPTTTERLAAILNGGDALARSAVALALTDLPQHMDPAYLDPLIAMLDDKDAAVRAAAASALTAGHSPAAIAKLRAVALDASRGVMLRRTVIETLARMMDRDALGVLVAVRDDARPELRGAALDGLRSATGLPFADGPDEVRAWWERNRDTPLVDWQRQQIERLMAGRGDVERRMEQLTARLVRALRDAYQRAGDLERPALLASFLEDDEAAVRLLALELVQAQLNDRTRTLTDETRAHVRRLLADADPRVRQAAVTLVAGFRDPADAETFLRMLGSETRSAVSVALINGLGYVGGVGCVDALLSRLDDESESIAAEAVAALGRLAERQALPADRIEQVVAALVAALERAARDRPTFRERALWAMERVADPRFGPVFVRALDAGESPGVRRAAASGIAALNDPALADALIPAVSDADAALRRAAVAALEKLASTDAHLRALWGRLAAAVEPTAQIRDSAWSGVLRVLSTRPPAEIESWAGRLPDNGDERARRAIELLQLAARGYEADPQARGDLGRVRVALARRLGELGRADESIATYLPALGDLHAVGSDQLTAVANELVCAALAAERYDERIPRALSGKNPPLDEAAVWEGCLSTVAARLNPAALDQALRMLDALETLPPVPLTDDARRSIAELRSRAQEVRAERDASTIRAALEVLRRQPQDEAARGAILGLGARAVPELRTAIRAAIAADAPDPAAESLLKELIQALVRDWGGFAPDAPRDAKLRAVDAIPVE